MQNYRLSVTESPIDLNVLALETVTKQIVVFDKDSFAHLVDGISVHAQPSFGEVSYRNYRNLLFHRAQHSQ